MRRSMMVVCALCCLTATLATAAEVDYEKAVAEAVKAGQAAEVNRLCVQWAKDEPGNEKPRLILGRALLKAGMTERAIEQFELAADANPLSPVPRCEMGRLFLREGKLDLAAKEFEQALRLDRKCLPAQLGSARVTFKRGEAADALDAVRRTMQEHPGNAQGLALVGECQLALGKTEEGLAQLARACEAAPENADTCYTYAAALELARQTRFTVVFIDAKLPDMDGLDIAALIRQQSRHTAIVLISGYFYQEDRAIAERLEDDAFISFVAKPFDLEEVRRMARRAVERERAPTADGRPLSQ